MLKPFFHRKFDPLHKSEFAFWRWFDIYGQRDSGQVSSTVYLRRFILFRCPWFNIFIHRMHRPDEDRHLHDHPWTFLSIVLRGHYLERRGRRIRTRRWFNFCRAEGAHKITYVSPTCTTLVITGPKRRAWGFHTERGWVDWRTYIYGPDEILMPKPVHVELPKNPPRPWSPCSGPDCTHPSHQVNRNWDEDAHLENGNYANRCVECKHTFIGYKRRVVCKACAHGE